VKGAKAGTSVERLGKGGVAEQGTVELTFFAFS